MIRRSSIPALLVSAALALPAVLWAAPDVPPISSLRPGAKRPAETPTGELPVFPELLQVSVHQAAPEPRPRADKLQPRSRLELIRYVMGEFARAVNPLPTDKKGYRHNAGKPVDEQALRRAASFGTAANPGDQIQITKLEFKGNEIWVDINGGARKKKTWRERISIGMGSGGGGPQVRTTQTGDQPSGPGGFQGLGSTIILEYEKDIPDLTPDDLKKDLSGFMDFSKQRSASVHWIDTLPKEFQEAIKEKRAMVGMDREMVIAAIGKPERKVRERDLDGLETEDWIYGHPPGETIFVKFAGEKVIAVREYPR